MLRIRSEPSCEAGKQYYTCTQDNSQTAFSGCCSVDACKNGGTCPDAASSSSSQVVTRTLVLTPIASDAASSTTSPPSSASSAATLAPTSTFEGPGVVGIATAASATLASSTSPSIATQTTTPTPNKSSNVPVIAGAVSGSVALLMFMGLLWFCLRRRRRNTNQRDSVEYGIPHKDFVLERSSSPNMRHLNVSNSVFEPFGGRYKSPSPSHSNMDHLRTPVEDKPIPDIEKQKAIPPPLSTHPAYHAVRTSSPPLEYHPGTEIPIPHIPSPVQSPINNSNSEHTMRPAKVYTPPLPSPPMREHPAYHIAQLPHHPVFRSSPKIPSQPPSPPFLHRTSGSSPRDIPIPRLTTTHLPRSGTPLPLLDDAKSPIPGHSELEAAVPVEYHSPPPLQTPISAISGAWFAPSGSSSGSNYSQDGKSQRHSYSQGSQRQSQSQGSQRQSKALPSRNGTIMESEAENQGPSHQRSDTTYSIPIGLGLQSKFSSIRKSKNRPQSIKTQPTIHYSNSETNLPSPSPTISGTLASTRKPHIMSWANELHVHSLPRSRSFNTVEIPMKNTGSGMLREGAEKEVTVVSPVEEEGGRGGAGVRSCTTTPAESDGDERWSGATMVTQDSSAATSVYSTETIKARTSMISEPSKRPDPNTAMGTGSWGVGSFHPSVESRKGKEREKDKEWPLPHHLLQQHRMEQERYLHIPVPAFIPPDPHVNTSSESRPHTPHTPQTAVSDGYGDGVDTWGSWVDR